MKFLKYALIVALAATPFAAQAYLISKGVATAVAVGANIVSGVAGAVSNALK